MMQKLIVAAAAAALCVPVPSIAQDMQPSRIEADSWHRVTFVKFKPGKRERASELIEKYFAPADRAAGNRADVRGYHLMTGEWDMIYTFEMPRGVEDLNWQRSPESIAWMAAMIEMTGSQEAAMKLLAEWEELVLRNEVHIAFSHDDW